MPFDAFLSYNRKDQGLVLPLSQALKAHGVRVWIDLDQEPGDNFVLRINVALKEVKAVLFCLGSHGFGKWQEREIEAALTMNVNRGIRLVPVRIPGAPDQLELPPLLASLNVLDVRTGTDNESVIQALCFAILGTRPDTTLSATLVAQAHESNAEAAASSSTLDAYAVATLKERLHAASEVVAQAAAGKAASMGTIRPHDSISLLIPLLYELGWQRGYVVAFNRMLHVPQNDRRLGNFQLRLVEGIPDILDGLLSAATNEDASVTIRVDGTPVMQVDCVNQEDASAVISAINAHGRLGDSGQGVLSLVDRLSGLLVPRRPKMDPDEEYLYRNREVLYPLIARFRIGGMEWLLPDSEDFPRYAVRPPDSNASADATPDAPPASRYEIFTARRARVRSTTFMKGLE